MLAPLSGVNKYVRWSFKLIYSGAGGGVGLFTYTEKVKTGSSNVKKFNLAFDIHAKMALIPLIVDVDIKAQF